MNEFSLALALMESLEELSLQLNTELPSKRTDSSSIYFAISNKYNMKKLKISDRNLNNISATALGKSLENFENIESLTISTQLDESETTIIIDSLRFKKKLVWLEFFNSEVNLKSLKQKTVMEENNLKRHSHINTYPFMQYKYVQESIWSKKD